MFMSGYAPCDTSDPPSGVCPDGVLNSDPKTGATVSKTAAGVQALDNVKVSAFDVAALLWLEDRGC